MTKRCSSKDVIAIIATEVAAVEAAVAVQDATIELEMVEKGRYWRPPCLVTPGVEAVVVQVATIEGGRETIVEVAALHQQRWQRWQSCLVETVA